LKRQHGAITMTRQTILDIPTSGRGTRNITDAVAKAVAASGVQTGIAHVFVQHTSCSLTITENADPAVRRDLETILSRLAPDGDPAYRHDLEGPDDMAAHARSVLTDVALTIPVGGGRLLLGTWQGIFLWEHRTSLQTRRVVVTVLGG
jgi:secondary thiamine-phosphate synthase enzyme